MRKHVPVILAAIAAVLAITLLVMLTVTMTTEEPSDFSAVQYTLDNLEAMDIDTSKL